VSYSVKAVLPSRWAGSRQRRFQDLHAVFQRLAKALFFQLQRLLDADSAASFSSG
jgi:hypothetical protein